MLNIAELTINFKGQFFRIPSGKGSIVLTFRDCRRRTLAIAEHYDKPELKPKEYGSAVAYFEYVKAVNFAESEYRRTGQPCPADLSPQLEGLEGREVEAETYNGERRRFWVGRSTGWLPSHVETDRPGAPAGAEASREYKSVRILN